ncbi:MAG: hypothetical protein H0X45_02280 [Planctomycetes bacterium]|nr:hypothetical protein [Planctomycetota bacterium]
MGAIGNFGVWLYSREPAPQESSIGTLPVVVIASCLMWFIAGRYIRNGRIGPWKTALFAVVSPAFGAVLAGAIMSPMFFGGSVVACMVVFQAWFIALPVGLTTGLLIYVINSRFAGREATTAAP